METPAIAQPKKRGGAHKPECQCGFCKVKRDNLAKKKPAQGAVAESKDSGGSGGQNTPPGQTSQPKPAHSTMKAKIEAMAKARKTKTKPAEKPTTVTHKGV